MLIIKALSHTPFHLPGHTQTAQLFFIENAGVATIVRNGLRQHPSLSFCWVFISSCLILFRDSL